MVHNIPLTALNPHPENSNQMDVQTFEKLKRFIERTGRYEPLIIRPQDGRRDKFQIINGHNRLRVLQAIGHPTAKCVVWDTDDDQTRLYLATLNRLSGDEVPERRVILLAGLLESYDTDELADLLPDSKEQLVKLQESLRIDNSDISVLPECDKEIVPIQVIVDFHFQQAEADEINLALDAVIHAREQSLSRSQALLQLARFYLKCCGDSAGPGGSESQA